MAHKKIISSLLLLQVIFLLANCDAKCPKICVMGFPSCAQDELADRLPCSCTYFCVRHLNDGDACKISKRFGNIYRVEHRLVRDDCKEGLKCQGGYCRKI